MSIDFAQALSVGAIRIDIFIDPEYDMITFMTTVIKKVIYVCQLSQRAG